MRGKHFCVLTTADSRTNIWLQQNVFKPPVASVAVRSKAVVLLLPLFMGYLCLVLVWLSST